MLAEKPTGWSLKTKVSTHPLWPSAILFQAKGDRGVEQPPTCLH